MTGAPLRIAGAAVLLVVLVAFPLACDQKEPPGPRRRAVSDRLAVKTPAGAGEAWVRAQRKKIRRTYSGRGGLGTFTEYRVDLQVVLRVGTKEHLVVLEELPSGETQKLPRYELSAGPQGTCLAVRAPKAKAWRRVRIDADGRLVRFAYDDVPAGPSAAPCAAVRSLRDEWLLRVREGRQLYRGNDVRLIQTLLAHPKDEALHEAFVAALLRHGARYRLRYLQPKLLRSLQVRICARKSLRDRLLQHGATDPSPDSPETQNRVLLLEGCQGSAPRTAAPRTAAPRAAAPRAAAPRATPAR